MATYPPQKQTLTQKIQYQTAPKNAAGQPVGLDGPISFSYDVTGVAVVAGHDSNNFTGEIDAEGVGTVQITAHWVSQGVPGSEVVQDTVTLDPAVTLGLSFSPPA